MRNDVCTSVPTAIKKSHLRGCHTTRRTVLTGAATLPALSLPAVAEGNPDAGVVDLARRLLAGIEAEYPLRLAHESAWAASERKRYQLLAANPSLRGKRWPVYDLLQRTAQWRRKAIAYDRWNEVCRECKAISQRILAETVHTGTGLAAYVLAYYCLEDDKFSKSHGGPLLRAAAAMLGEKLPSHLNEDIQKELNRVVQPRADVA